MPKKAKLIPIPVRVDADLLKTVDDLATHLGEPRATVMRMALRVGARVLRKSTTADLLEAVASDESAGRYPDHQPQSMFVEDKPPQQIHPASEKHRKPKNPTGTKS